MSVVTYDFPDHLSGDTFAGVQFTVNRNGSALDITSAAIVMTVNEVGGIVDYTLSVGSGVTITNGATGTFQVDAQIISWPPTTYRYKIKITLAGGEVHTYLSGGWTITPSTPDNG